MVRKGAKEQAFHRLVVPDGEHAVRAVIPWVVHEGRNLVPTHKGAVEWALRARRQKASEAKGSAAKAAISRHLRFTGPRLSANGLLV
jgi:hypothetical protein